MGAKWPDDGVTAFTITDSSRAGALREGPAGARRPHLGEVCREIDVIVVPRRRRARPERRSRRCSSGCARSGARGGLLTSVCTGAFVLQAAGALDGKPATTHWGAMERLRDSGRRARRALRRRGRRDHGRGVSAGIDMARRRGPSVPRSRRVECPCVRRPEDDGPGTTRLVGLGRVVQRHQRSPGCRPANSPGRLRRREVVAGGLAELEELVGHHRAHRWLPTSSGRSSSSPHASKPVSGSVEQGTQLAADDVHIRLALHRDETLLSARERASARLVPRNTAATCPGARHAIRTRSSSPR